MKGTVQVCDVITLFFFANLRVSETQWLFLVFRRNTATDSIPLKITSHIWATRIWVSIKFIAVWNLWGSPWPIIHLLGSTILFARDWIRFWIFSTNATEGGFQCRFVSLTVFIDRVFFWIAYCRDARWDKVQHECIRCLKAISNNKVGLKKLFEHREALTLLARSFVPSLPAVMVEAVKLMAGICLVPPEGHERALEAITTSGELKSISRFQPIIEALTNMENDTLTVTGNPTLLLFTYSLDRVTLSSTWHCLGFSRWLASSWSIPLCSPQMIWTFDCICVTNSWEWDSLIFST